MHADTARLASAGLDTFTADQWRDLIALAGEQRVRPLLHQRLHAAGYGSRAPQHLWQPFADECRGLAIRKVRMHAELAHVTDVLTRAHIPVIALKGAFLGPVVYGNVGLREMNDLDILVPRDRLKDAVDLVMAEGYRGYQPFSIEHDAKTNQHVTRLMQPGRTGIEIHWTITKPGQLTTIDPQVLWQAATPEPRIAVQALGLSPEDLLLYVCFHSASLHQFEFGLRPSCDIAWIVAHYAEQLDWDAVAALAHERRWARGVFLALQLAKHLIGAAVPDDWLGRHAPSGLAEAIPVAEGLLWATPDEIKAASRGLDELVAARTLGDKVAMVKRRFFPKDARATTIEGSAAGGARRGWFLAREIADVTRRAASSWAQSFAESRSRDGESTTAAMARQRSAIRAWLSSEP
jgi:hypothetical protein